MEYRFETSLLEVMMLRNSDGNGPDALVSTNAWYGLASRMRVVGRTVLQDRKK